MTIRQLDFFNNLAEDLGVEADILKTAISLFLSLFLSPVYRVLQTKNSKNLMSIIVGACILIFILEQWSLFIFGGIIIPYILMKIFNRPFLISVICSILLLLIVHCYRFFYLYSVWKVDCSVYIMLLVTKLTYFGKYLEKEKDKKNITCWDFLGYNLYFSGIIVGPTFSFQTYLIFIQNRLNISFKNLNLLKALAPFFISLPLSILTVYTLPMFPKNWVIQSKFYLQLSLLGKIAIIYPVGFLYRVKYYAAWYFAQGAVNLSGLSLSTSGEYDAVKSVSLKFQTEANPRNKTEHWNSSMQEWLKIIVYESLSQKLGGRYAFFGTFLISAFWHGIYLSYYYGFLLWGILLHITKWTYKISEQLPKKITRFWLFSIAKYILSSALMNYIGMFMLVMNWEDAWNYHSDIFHWGTITFTIFLLLSFIVKVPKKTIIQKKL